MKIRVVMQPRAGWRIPVNGVIQYRTRREKMGKPLDPSVYRSFGTNASETSIQSFNNNYGWQAQGGNYE